MDIEALSHRHSAFKNTAGPWTSGCGTVCSLATGVDMKQDTISFLLARYFLHSTLDKGRMDISFPAQGLNKSMAANTNLTGIKHDSKTAWKHERVPELCYEYSDCIQQVINAQRHLRIVQLTPCRPIELDSLSTIQTPPPSHILEPFVGNKNK